MRFLERFHEYGAFTRREALALLLCAGTFLGGMVIKKLRASFDQEHRSIPQFDYSKSDSAYSAGAQSLSIRDTGKHFSEPRVAIVDPRSFVSRERSPQQRNLASNSININTASKSELMKLPGIGPSYAERIIAYRQTNGKFTSADQLRNVKGIGVKKMEQIRRFLRVQ